MIPNPVRGRVGPDNQPGGLPLTPSPDHGFDQLQHRSEAGASGATDLSFNAISAFL